MPGNQCAVVVSAMAGHTNQLVDWTRAAHHLCMMPANMIWWLPPANRSLRGFWRSCSSRSAFRARSWLGWQIPIKTDNAHGVARIAEIPGGELKERWPAEKWPLSPDFRASARPAHHDAGARRLRYQRRRGRRRLRADRCDIYTDVDGVYTTDPRIVPKARRLAKISYEEMLEMASLGAKVLQTRSVELAMVHRVPVQVRSSFEPPESCPAFGGNGPAPGTLVCDEEEILEQRVVSGIAYAKDEAKVTLMRVADKPGVAARVFGPLAEANINVDMIVQNVSDDGRFTDMTFTVPASDLDRALNVLEDAKAQIGYSDLRGADRYSKSLCHRRWHEKSCGRRGANVQCSCRKRYKYRGHLYLGN